MTQKSPEDVFSDYMSFMNERVSDHAKEFRQSLNYITSQLSVLKEQQHVNRNTLLDRMNLIEKELIAKQHKTELKMSGIAATVALIMTGVMEWFKNKLGTQ